MGRGVAEAERLLREAGSDVVVALSGTETNELAYGLAKLAAAVGGTVVLPEQDPQPLRRPLSDLAQASAVAVEDDVPLEESAPVADLWVRQGRRNGAAGEEISVRVPRTPNGIGVAHAVGRAGANASNSLLLGSPALVLVSGDEAAADPALRELVESAESVIAVTMFQGLVVGWADLVLPGTSYLERDGSMTNMEGRVQRLRRAVIPPGPDELAWLAKLAGSFGVELSPHAALVYEELFGEAFDALGETAPLNVLRSGPDRCQAPARSEGDAFGSVPAALLRAARRARSEVRLPAAERRGRGVLRRRPAARTARRRHDRPAHERHDRGASARDSAAGSRPASCLCPRARRTS